MFGLPDTLKSKVEKHSSRFYKVLKNSLKIKGDNILIITDYGLDTNNLATMFGYGYYHPFYGYGSPFDFNRGGNSFQTESPFENK